MNNNTTRPSAIIHGECFIFSANIPSTAIKEKHENAQHVIVANSETTGNHHVIELNPHVSFYREGNKRYMQNTKPTNIKCILPNRHDTCEIAPGSYEIGISQEFDYITQAKRNVRD